MLDIPKARKGRKEIATTVRSWIENQSRQVSAEGAARNLDTAMGYAGPSGLRTFFISPDHALTDVAIS